MSAAEEGGSVVNLRQAAQQALEALERGETKLRWAAITALRAALAEPQCMCREPWALERVHREKTPCFDYVERKPLPEEEIVRLMVGEDRVQLLYAKPDDPYFSEFAQGAIRELVESGRAIERAHGIGEQHE